MKIIRSLIVAIGLTIISGCDIPRDYYYHVKMGQVEDDCNIFRSHSCGISISDCKSGNSYDCKLEVYIVRAGG